MTASTPLILPDDYARIGTALSQFGFTSSEIRLYLLLATKGGMKAGQLSKELNTNRLDTYSLLKQMQAKQLVHATISKPMVFMIVPFSEVLERLRRELEVSQRRQKNALATLEAESAKLQAVSRRGSEKLQESDRIQFLTGRKPLREKWLAMLEQAKEEIIIAAGKGGTARALVLNGMDILVAQAKKGTEVHVLTPVTVADKEEIGRIAKSVRHLPTAYPAGLCLVDGSKAMIIIEAEGGAAPPQARETAIVTESRSIAKLLRTLFFVGWDTSPDFATMQKQIRAQ